MTVTVYLTIYDYRCSARECRFRWFSLEPIRGPRCPKCWWWAKPAEPTTVSRPDWLATEEGVNVANHLCVSCLWCEELDGRDCINHSDDCLGNHGEKRPADRTIGRTDGLSAQEVEDDSHATGLRSPSTPTATASQDGNAAG